MLNQHRNLVVPESDLLRVGECVVDLPRREIRGPNGDAPRRITVKAQQVLLVLVSHRDRVVSREALLEWVWPDTLPTDDVLTQAITQLRKAFGDDRDASRYLETIAKGGYRLVAPIEWLPVDTMSPPAAAAPGLPHLGEAQVAAGTSATVVALHRTAPGDAPAHHAHADESVAITLPAALAHPSPHAAAATGGRRLLPLLATVVLVSVVALLGLAALQRNRSRSNPVIAPAAAPATMAQPTYQRITSLPGSEMFPSLSPDGSQVVYSAYSGEGEHADLMVQTTAPVPGHRITQAPAGAQDTMPAWSPDGRQIAFARLGPDEQCRIMMVPASGGEPRTITRCQPGWEAGVSWHPDGTRLLTTLTGVSKGDDGGIYTIDLGTGTWTRLPYRKGAGDADLGPQYSPDGKWIAFHRNVSLSDLWRMPAQGGEPERLTNLRTNVYALAWAPDSQSIVFGRYRDAAVSLARLDLRTREVSDMGIPDTAYPSIAIKAPSLAFTISDSHSALFGMPLDLASTASPSTAAPSTASASAAMPAATPLFPSTGLDLLPSISPDGTQVAFMSDRSARIGVWWAQLGRPESLRLIEGVVPVPRYGAMWSADSKRMLVVGRGDSEGSDAHLGLFEITPESGSVRRLPVPVGEPVYGEYVPGTSRILVVADRDAGRLGVTLYDTASTPWEALASIEDVALTKVDAQRGHILFTRPSKPGLWQADLQLQGARQVSERPAVGGGRRLVVTDADVWIIAAGEKCGLLQVPILHPQGRERCLQQEQMGVTGVSYDARHQRLYYSVERESAVDVGWMRLPPIAAR